MGEWGEGGYVLAIWDLSSFGGVRVMRKFEISVAFMVVGGNDSSVSGFDDDQSSAP